MPRLENARQGSSARDAISFGLLFVRVGQYDKAIAKLQSEDTAGLSDPRIWYSLAMAHHHLGNADQALSFARKGNAIKSVSALSWTEQLAVKHLHDEAGALLKEALARDED